MATTRPIINGGKTLFSFWIIGAIAISTKPAIIIMPRIKGRPPVHAAESERLKYDGPQRFGQRYPEPINGSPTDWTIDPIPAASIEKAIREIANCGVPFI